MVVAAAGLNLTAEAERDLPPETAAIGKYRVMRAT
jgi:hypothetical protein